MVRGAASSRPQKAPISTDDRLPCVLAKSARVGVTSVQTAGLSAAMELRSCLQQTAIFFPLLAL